MAHTVVSLVHGTFDSNAQWTLRDSKMCQGGSSVITLREGWDQY